ncbi:putative phage-type endonuclease [Paraburkholderia sp. WSM4175]|uniref:YqaJ viral recombinase family nuclease n=1 Tax=Paraburkholderia sp. WSM4175 TaxID=2991072 RepID=UPI003D1C18D7
MGTREQWLELRRAGVGGSDAAAALGQSPYVTRLELYFDKIGQQVPRDMDAAGVERTDFGRALEGVIADQYARRFNVRLRRRNQILRHPKYPFMLANIDRLVEGQRRGVEIKNVDAMAYRFGEWGEPGSDEVPTPYLLQTVHYMSVCDYPVWDIGACVGGNRLVVYHIERDAELEQMLIEGEALFWQYVERREPPPPDFDHPTTIGLLKRMYPGTDGGTIDLPAEIQAWHQVRLDADAQTKLYQAVADGARAHILHAMANAAVGRLPEGGQYRRKAIHREAYTVPPCDYQTLTFAKAKAADTKENNE